MRDGLRGHRTFPLTPEDTRMRIPTKPDTYSNMMPDTYSNMKPDTDSDLMPDTGFALPDLS